MGAGCITPRMVGSSLKGPIQSSLQVLQNWTDSELKKHSSTKKLKKVVNSTKSIASATMVASNPAPEEVKRAELKMAVFIVELTYRFKWWIIFLIWLPIFFLTQISPPDSRANIQRQGPLSSMFSLIHIDIESSILWKNRNSPSSLIKPLTSQRRTTCCSGTLSLWCSSYSMKSFFANAWGNRLRCHYFNNYLSFFFREDFNPFTEYCWLCIWYHQCNVCWASFCSEFTETKDSSPFHYEMFVPFRPLMCFSWLPRAFENLIHDIY